MRHPRAVIAAVLATGTLASLAGCSSSGGSATADSGAANASVYTFWDPYPQFDASSAWAKTVSTCGTQAGVTIQRSAMDTTYLGERATLASQEGQAPDVMLVDNPLVATLVKTKVLTRTSDLGLSTAQLQKNVLGAGVVDGAAYGIPIGANTLALYYNKNVLSAAGVDISTVTDWASLTAALRKAKAAGKKGITFAAIGTEEGSFQFEPWFWGAGGDLTRLARADGVAALTLWKDWVSQGLAPKDVLGNNQTAAWKEFATGQYAFGENGTWQLANADKAGFPYGVISIPAKGGGAAPTPTGGEFVTVPEQADTSRYATDKKIIECLTTSKNLLSTDTTLSYLAPTAAVQAQQAAQNPELGPWLSALATARGRTSNGLGADYPEISRQVWTALDSALSGFQSPQVALTVAGKASPGQRG
ncbi:sugar ABC transporter substrate-binding protein [Streptacidiphilus carbonis]|uniref:sugar ABC transporter substrate-binding protein n=1 Tax=Streptacidiphilus carbonis TaxID=105422 RepID=UPI0005AA009A|nr:extracellular solute-binding protein [Streptacidiphilus carbonis]